VFQLEDMGEASMNIKLTISAIAIASSGALAGSVDYDAVLNFPGSGDLDGIVGSGISNDNFVRTINGNVEVGLKSIERFVGNLNNTNDVYTASRGTSESTSGTVGSTWNYVMAIDLGSATISDYQIDLMVDFDPAAGSTNFTTLDYTAALESFGLGGLSTFGDSQNLLFSFWQNDLGAPAFDPNALGEYELRLTVRDRVTDALIADVSNTVNVVPLPGAAWAGLGLLGGLAGVRAVRRR
jgi:hypothetical protein